MKGLSLDQGSRDTWQEKLSSGQAAASGRKM